MKSVKMIAVLCLLAMFLQACSTDLTPANPGTQPEGSTPLRERPIF